MEYDKEFEELWKYVDQKRELKEIAFTIWQSARKDHYRIGEEVQIDCRTGGQGWERGLVGALTSRLGSGFIDKPDRVRRWPEWEPVDGQSILYCDSNNRSVIGVYSKKENCVYHGVFNGIAKPEYMKPFSADKIGKPWGEI